MRISRNSESGGRPLSTADLAAAARHSDAVTDDDEVLDESTPDESTRTRPKDQSAEPVLGRPAADDRLRASAIEADLPPHRAEVREPDRPPVRAPVPSERTS